MMILATDCMHLVYIYIDSDCMHLIYMYIDSMAPTYSTTAFMHTTPSLSANI